AAVGGFAVGATVLISVFSFYFYFWPPGFGGARMGLFSGNRRPPGARSPSLPRQTRSPPSPPAHHPRYPPLVVVAEKMEGDAMRHEEEACLLLAKQMEA